MAKDVAAMAEEKPLQLEGRLSTMPEHYIPQGKKGLSTKALLIIGGLGLLIVVAVVLVLLFLPSDQPAPQPAPQAPVVTPTPQPQQPPQEPVEEPEEPEPEEVPEEEVPEQAVSLPSVGVAQFRNDVDTDQDGLTDVEEQLLATSVAVPDTDSDSFLDAAEVLNLYDPATPGALLEVSPQVKIARNANRGYQLLIPDSWTAAMVTPNGQEFVVTPESGSEMFRISVYENPDRGSALQWYQDQVPGAEVSQFVNFSNEAGWSGIQSRDKTLVIATFGESGPGARGQVFVMHYDTGNGEILRFPTLWGMMINSLAILETSGEEE